MTAGVEGSIDVVLRTSGDKVAAATVVNRRPLQAARMFEDKPLDKVLPLLPLLFSLCGTAQGLAALDACEAAAGCTAAIAQRQARRLLLLAETAVEHAQRILCDWPVLAGEDPDLAAAAAVRRELSGLRPATFGKGPWLRLGGADVAPDHGELACRITNAGELVARHVFECQPDDALGDADAFDRWVEARSTPAARLLADVRERGWADLGGDAPLLPEVDRAWLEATLAADDGTFMARPVWQGRPAETGPLARLRDHLLLQALRARHRNGVLPRLAARLLELAQALQDMRALAPDLRPDGAADAVTAPSGAGLGMVPAARGLLVHRVSLDGGVIRRYQILAPTEWNLHPEGALARALIGWPVAEARRLAPALVTALDPCVQWRLVVTGAREDEGTEARLPARRT